MQVTTRSLSKWSDWFLKNLDGPFDDKRTNVHPPFFKKKNLDDYDVANGAWLAATQAGGPTAIYEFVAKILHRSQWPQGFLIPELRK